jgi:hypothetical protein
MQPDKTRSEIMPTIGEKIATLAIEELRANPDGVRWADRIRAVQPPNQ